MAKNIFRFICISSFFVWTGVAMFSLTFFWFIKGIFFALLSLAVYFLYIIGEDDIERENKEKNDDKGYE